MVLPRRDRLGLALVTLGTCIAPRLARADLERLPSEGNAVVTLAPDRRSLRIDGGKPIAIAEVPGAAAWPEKTKGATIDLGQGKTAVHVVLPLANGASWELLASSSGDPWFAGVTGEAGESVELRAMTSAGRPATIVRGKTNDRVQLCGVGKTLLAPEGLDPKTGTWKRASLQQLGTAARAAARTVTAEETSEPKPAPVLLLEATGASSGDARAATDENPKTAWHEERPGIGQGEFVIANAAGAPLSGLTLLLGDAEGQNSPASFYVLTDRAMLHVTAPAAPASTWLRVTFPEPVTTTCLAVVLDSAHTEARDPNVSLREMRAITARDADDAWPLELARAAPRDEAARRLLARTSAMGRATLVREFWKLPPESRRAVVEALEPALPCEDMASLEALALADAALAPLATRFFDRCTTRGVRGLLEAFDASDARVRSELAGTVALLARREAAAHLLPALGQGDRATRGRLRTALARVLAGLGQDERGTLAQRATSLDPAAFVDVVLAFGAHAGENEASFLPRLHALVAQGDFDTLWDVAPALAVLAERGALLDDDRALLTHAEAALRTRAARLAPARLSPALLASARDASPRVREAALERLTELDAPRADVATRALTDDFAFVRVAAARALRGVKDDASQAGLARLLDDPILRVRVAALDALGARPSTRLELFERIAFDATAAAELRTSAFAALATRCRTTDPARVEALARHIAAPVDPGDYKVAFAAFATLARVKPQAAAKIREEVAATGRNRGLLSGLDQALVGPGCRP